jgi:hypothetical protein
MAEKDSGQVIQEDSHEPSHYAMIPKMAMMDLDPYELVLYCHYKMTASEHGKCWKANKTLANETGMSETKMRMARTSLVAKGFITLTHTPDEKGNINSPPTITIVSVWAENRKRYAKKEVDPLAPRATPPSQSATPLAPRATKEDPSEEEPKNKSIAPKVAKVKPDTIPAALINPMKDALVKAFGWNSEKMTRGEWGLIQRTAKELCSTGFEAERIDSFYAWCNARFTKGFSPVALTTHLSEYRAARLDTPKPSTTATSGDAQKARLQHDYEEMFGAKLNR